MTTRWTLILYPNFRVEAQDSGQSKHSIVELVNLTRLNYLRKLLGSIIWFPDIILIAIMSMHHGYAIINIEDFTKKNANFGRPSL